MRAPNELKVRTLELFVRSGPIRPAEYMVRAKFYPIQAADYYLRRLARMGLLQRSKDSRGHYLYRISERGKERLAWLRDLHKRTGKWYAPSQKRRR